MFGLPRATADGEFNEAYFNNTCIVLGESAGIYFKVWEPLSTLLPSATGGLSFPVTVHDNRLYGNLSVCAPWCWGNLSECGGCLSMESWLALGLDPGTAVISTQAPPPAQIVRLARRVLGI